MVALDDNPLAVRQMSDGLRSRVEAIRRALSTPAALPSARERAKDELLMLADECNRLWEML